MQARGSTHDLPRMVCGRVEGLVVVRAHDIGVVELHRQLNLRVQETRCMRVRSK
jgi:hypothetical protein